MALRSLQRRSMFRMMERVLKTQTASSQHDVKTWRDDPTFFIGKREIVGFGMNGQLFYVDRVDVPFPSVRYKEPSKEIESLRAKEQDDWKKLSIEEKKALYRASFGQTYAEMMAPTGFWKAVLGTMFLGFGATLWIFMLLLKSLPPKISNSLEPQERIRQMRKAIDIEANPITGLASQWDYEKNTWK